MSDADFCENFTGGWCPKAKSHVPRSWCLSRCDIKKSYPGIMKMAVGFAKESAKYIRAGRPKRTDDEIERIKPICQECVDFDKDKQRCRVCGCGMKRKIPWQTTACPKNKWLS